MTYCSISATTDYMEIEKILMDADCLIKITKAGLKDLVCKYFQIYIPEVVRVEVVDAGKQKQCSDAMVVENNIQSDKLMIAKSQEDHPNGDSALFSLFSDKNYDAVATDDTKLTRRLKAAGIPFLLPAIILYILILKKKLTIQDATRSLDELSEFISEDELSSVRILLEKKNES